MSVPVRRGEDFRTCSSPVSTARLDARGYSRRQ
jgi:hypothetical protein